MDGLQVDRPKTRPIREPGTKNCRIGPFLKNGMLGSANRQIGPNFSSRNPRTAE